MDGNPEGGTLPKDARWFSVTIKRDDLPEFFKDYDGKRTVAAWELLATVMAMTAFHQTTGQEARALAVSKGITDNQGNSFLLNKMMSTKFPLNVILMQAATTLETSGHWLDLTWVSMDQMLKRML